MSSVGFYNY